MCKLLILSLFCFAAASAGLIGSPYSPYAPYAPYSPYVGHAYAAPVVAHSPLAYHAPVVKAVAPVAYHSAPVIAKAVYPAATSYSNTYKISQSVHPVVAHAPVVAHSPYVSHAVAPIIKSYASPYAVAHASYPSYPSYPYVV